jgi:hypothetical protein
MSSRRSFLSKAAMLASSSLIPSLKAFSKDELLTLAAYQSEKSALELATDEDYWWQIQQAYTVSPQIINLNNGGVSPSPMVVQNAVEQHNS